MYNHNKAQQSKNRVHISWDILYCWKNTMFELSASLSIKFINKSVPLFKKLEDYKCGYLSLILF